MQTERFGRPVIGLATLEGLVFDFIAAGHW